MDQYITGLTIKRLREKSKLTQSDLATKLSVSDKAISKWEIGRGYPDITLIEDITKVFNVSITELFSGDTIENENISSKSVSHEMAKGHYISFIAAVSSDRLQLVKLYPEFDVQVRFKIKGVKKIYCYCNKDGLYYCVK